MIKLHATNDKLQHIQAIANSQPVLIDTGKGNTLQVLMSYDEYLKMGGEPQEPFVDIHEQDKVAHPSLADIIGYSPASNVEIDF